MPVIDFSPDVTFNFFASIGFYWGMVLGSAYGALSLFRS